MSLLCRHSLVFYVPAPWVASGEQPAFYKKKFFTKAGARHFARKVLREYLNAYGMLLRYEIL